MRYLVSYPRAFGRRESLAKHVAANMFFGLMEKCEIASASPQEAKKLQEEIAKELERLSAKHVAIQSVIE